ncbi:hypothetical protein LINPERHAP2_LOCUS14532 [Linum perenne]
MAACVDEEQVWKCASHPSRRRRIGVCHRCLRERLTALCPDCADARPCSCSSSSASDDSIGRVVESEPSFRRSRSLAIPFLRSSSKHPADSVKKAASPAPSIWSVLKGSRRKHEHELDEMKIKKKEGDGDEEERTRVMMMRKSRSVAVTALDSGRSESRGWHFPSPMKVFRRQSINPSRPGGAALLVHERPPLPRG